jgi:hypothetical protein
MADEDATISYDGAGEGPDSQPDPIDEGSETREGPYVTEDDEEGADELADDAGQGGDAASESDGVNTGRAPKPQAETQPDPVELGRRLQEKESQAASLTRALQQERGRARVLEHRFYQVIEKAMQHTAGEAPEGEKPEAEFDPDDAVGAINKKLDSITERLDRGEQDRAEKETEAATDGALGWVRQDAQRTLQAEPGYLEAAQVAEDSTRRAIYANLQLAHPEVEEFELQGAVDQLFANYIAKLQVHCMQNGISYSKAVLSAAKTLGWKPSGNGKAPARRSSALEAERTARAGGPSLGRIPSATPRHQPRPADVLNMEDDEFDAFLDSNKVDFKLLAAQLASGGQR